MKRKSYLFSQGTSLREIVNRLGFTYEQMSFKTRCNKKQRKIASGIALNKKGRPPKDCIVTERDKLAELRYKLARKDELIKRLEMENELMRDFLSLTEWKREQA